MVIISGSTTECWT